MSPTRAGARAPRSLPVAVRVSAPARLHLGLIDVGATLGRRFGSVGVAIDEPRTELLVRAEGRDDVASIGADLGPRLGPDAAAALEARLAQLVVRHRVAGLPAPRAVRVVLEAAPPPHAGFGSGTQLALSVGTALAHVAGHALDPAVVALALHRGGRSGVGVAAFAGGGLVVDAGHAAGADEDAPTRVPPVVARHALPEAWRFVVVVPDGPPGLSGARERAAFRRLPSSSPERVAEICRLLLLGLLPGALEEDLATFGSALTLIQHLAGDELAAAQGGRFASPLVEAAIGRMLDAGAAGAGQSSWGPACYGVVGSVEAAEELAARMRQWLAAQGPRGEVLVARTDNAGARVAATGGGDGGRQRAGRASRGGGRALPRP